MSDSHWLVAESYLEATSCTMTKYSPDAATSTVFATLSFVLMVGGAVILAFEYLRSAHTDIYEPRQRKQGHRILRPPPPGPFLWIKHVMNVSDDDFFSSVGLDGYVLLRFLRLCCKLSLLCAFLGLTILAPIYFSCPGNDGVAGINLYTMANVEQDGKALWAPFVLTWAFTLGLLYLLHHEYGAFAHHRQGFLERGDPDMLKPQTTHSVLVENIPSELRTTEKLTDFFDGIFPEEVQYASISVSMQPLTDAVEQRNVAVANAELAVAAREASKTKERPVIRLYKGVPVHSVCSCGSVLKVDAINYYQAQITELDKKVVQYQREARKAEMGEDGGINSTDVKNPFADNDVLSHKDDQSDTKSRVDVLKDLNFLAGKTSITRVDVSGTGFITFKTRRAQAAACQVNILSQKYPDIKVFAAPEPADIIWPNITTKIQYTKETSGLTKIMYYMGISFWGLVLAFIATISNLTILDDYIPFISGINPVLYAVIAGVLPVLMLSFFMSYLPVIMEWVAHFVEKRKTRSAVTMEVFEWYFVYQITNVYLLMLAGSVATAISDVIDDPSSILTTLGYALPSISVFFINYSLNALFVEIPVDMLRIAPLAIIQLYRFIFDEKALTVRQVLEGPLADEPLDYGRDLPTLMYFLVLCITYWTIAPILVGILALIFLYSTISWKYKMLYVYAAQYEAGGMYWYGLYKYTMYALVASTLTMIGYMGLKEGAAQSAGLFPLLYVIYRAWGYTEDSYKDISLHLAYSTAVDADSSRLSLSRKPDPLRQEFHADYYKQPAYSAPETAKLQAYRINRIPLFTKNGQFSSVYNKSIPQASDEELDTNEESKLLGASSSTGYNNKMYRGGGRSTADGDLMKPLTGHDDV